MRIQSLIGLMCICWHSARAQCDSMPLIFFPDEHFLCAGNTLLIDPGIVATSYQWSTGDTSGSIVISAEGTYCLTVTDAQGCTSSGCTEVIVPPVPVVLFSADPWVCGPFTTDVFVQGDFVAYEWSTGDVTEFLFVQEEGEYCVTVTDQYGCRGSDCFTFEQIIVEPEILGDLEFCSGDATELYTNGFYMEYLWSTGTSTQHIVINITGVYCLTVTDIHGCSGSTCVSVIEIPQVVVTIDSLVCEGNFTNIRNADSREWVENETVVHRSDLCDTVFLTEIILDIIDVQYSISGNPSTGSASIHLHEIMGGQEPYSYQWSTGSHKPQISGLFAGQYTVTITDARGCSVSNTFSLSPLPRPDVTTVEPVIISPNPFTTDITVYTELLMTKSSVVSIYNELGMQVALREIQDSRERIEVPGTTGVYFIHVKDGSGHSFIRRAIKMD